MVDLEELLIELGAHGATHGELYLSQGAGDEEEGRFYALVRGEQREISEVQFNALRDRGRIPVV